MPVDFSKRVRRVVRHDGGDVRFVRLVITDAEQKVRRMRPRRHDGFRKLIDVDRMR